METDLKVSPALLRAMKVSLHPPHAIEIDEANQHIMPNPAFPFCFYGSQMKNQPAKQHGSYIEAYQENYCNSFQTTFNEHGLCYTFNNADQGLDDVNNHENPENSRFFGVRKVRGCGKKRGLQLVLDSQRMSSLIPKEHLTKGFRIFVTLPGVVTSKVPFWADPTFRGEHNFFIHGIHVIKV